MEPAEHSGELGAFLREREGEILAAWEASARALPVAARLSSRELLDHLPAMLAQIATMAEQIEAGEEPVPPREDAEHHAHQRLGEGFDLAEVVREYALLRAVIQHMWERERGGASTAVLHDAIDRAIALSVDRYTDARDRAMKALDRISSAALQATDLNAFLQDLLQVFVETTTAVDTTAVLLREGDRIRVRATVGLEEETQQGFSLRIGEGFAGWIAAARRPRETACAAEDPDVKSPVVKSKGVRAMYGVPLLDDGELIGVAHMGSRVAHEFSDEDKRLFNVMATRAGVAIQMHRLRDEARRQATELRHLAQLIAVHPDFFYLLDTHQRFTFVSPSLLALWGRTAQEALGKNFAELGYPPELVALHRQQLDDVLRGAVVRGDNAYPTPDGARHYEYIFAPVRNADGVVEAVAGVTRDITGHKQQEQLLATTSELRERLIGILAHDLRSPLSAIQLAARLLLANEQISATALPAVTRIANSSGRMDRMIRDVVDFVRTRHGGRIQIAPRPANLTEICAGVVEELELTHPDRAIKLRTWGTCEGCWDADRLAQVVSNLIGNAIAHGSPQRPVLVSLTEQPEHVMLEVHSWGTPIPPEAMPHIFEPFRSESRERRGGLGLGLYIVREIVTSHGGHIDVSSTAQEGTSFRVQLPKRIPG